MKRCNFKITDNYASATHNNPLDLYEKHEQQETCWKKTSVLSDANDIRVSTV